MPNNEHPPLWKRSPVLAGAMMLLKGYVEPVSVCDGCARSLAHASGLIDVTFKDRAAHYVCPHCGHTSTRPIGMASR